MKLNKLWASALALLALTACNKDIEPSVNVPEPEAPQTKLVNIEITADRNLDDLRAIFELNGEGKPGKLIMSDKDLRVYIAVKGINADPSADQTPVYSYQEKTFTKVAGENRATYTGQISVPTKEGVTYNYQLSAALLGEAGPKSEKPKTFMAVRYNKPNLLDHLRNKKHYQGEASSDGKQLEINVPYVTKWTDVSLNNEKSSINPVYLQFVPRGTVLRYRIANHTSEEKEVKRIDFISTAFGAVNGIALDYEHTSEGGFPGFASGSNSEFVREFYTETNEPTTIRIPAKQGTKPSYSPWFYHYVYPTPGVLPQYLTTRVDLLLANGSKLNRVFETKQPLNHGSVKVTLHVKGTSSDIDSDFGDLDDQDNEWESSNSTRPKMALEYVANHVVNNNETTPGFVDNDNVDRSDLGFYTFARALELFKTPRNIVGGKPDKKYSLPTVEEANSIFPSGFGRAGDEVHLMGVHTMSAKDEQAGKVRLISNVLDPNVKIGNTTANYTSDFKIMSRSKTYALRFKSSSNYHLTAYRYQYEGTSKVDRRIVVTCRYVGNDSTIDINKVSEDSFWQGDPNDYVTRVFPMYGIIPPGQSSPAYVGVAGSYLTQDLMASNTMFIISVQDYIGATWRDRVLDAFFSVRLWERD